MTRNGEHHDQASDHRRRHRVHGLRQRVELGGRAGSSSGIRESCYFGTPCVNIGNREKDRERGSNVVDVDHDNFQIKNAILTCIQNGREPPENILWGW